MSPYVEKWPEAMALGLKHPNAIPTGLMLHNISDQIWHLAGDRSVDITWYMRRSMLVKVYIATELVMINDKSEGFGQTWEFLDRRIENAKMMNDMLDKSP